jgi:hypothetical protein
MTDTIDAETTLDQPQLVPGGLYRLNRPVYPPDQGSQFKDGLWFAEADWLPDVKEEELILFGQQAGIYTGTTRVVEDIRRPKSKGGSKRWRKLVHVFLWGGNRVILQPDWVEYLL